jgi:hypothetical protein
MGNCFSQCCSVDKSSTYSDEAQCIVTPEISSDLHSDERAFEGSASVKSASLRSKIGSKRLFNFGDPTAIAFLGESSVGRKDDEHKSVLQQSSSIEAVCGSSAARCITPLSVNDLSSEAVILKPYIQQATEKTGRNGKDKGLLIYWHTTLASLITQPSHPLPTELTPYLQPNHLCRIYNSGSVDEVLKLLKDIVQRGVPILLPVVDHYFRPLMYIPKRQL